MQTFCKIKMLCLHTHAHKKIPHSIATPFYFLLDGYSMVPDKNRAVFIRTSGGIPPVFISVDHVFLFLHPVIFIQTMFCTSIPLRFLFRPHFFKMLHQECYCNKRFKVIHTPVVFIWTMFFR